MNKNLARRFEILNNFRELCSQFFPKKSQKKDNSELDLNYEAWKKSSESISGLKKFTMVDFPLVSIVIPAFKPQFFEQALRSAIGQTYKNCEIWVSDDSVGDEIANICKKFSNINYVKTDRLGPTLNIVKTLNLGSGEYIKPLFDDDVLHPFCIEKMIAIALQIPECQLIFSQSSVIDLYNNKTINRRPFKEDIILDKNDFIEKMVVNFSNFVGEFSTIFFSRSRLQNFPDLKMFRYLNEDYLRGLGDVVFYLNLVGNNKAYYIDEELSYFRLDSEHLSNSAPSSDVYQYAVLDWMRILMTSYESKGLDFAKFQQARDSVEKLHDDWVHKLPELSELKKAYFSKL